MDLQLYRPNRLKLRSSGYSGFDDPEYKSYIALLDRAYPLVAETVGQWCKYFCAKPLAPKRGFEKAVLIDTIPRRADKRKIRIDRLFSWLKEVCDPRVHHLFILYIDPELTIAEGKGDRNPKFDHHDNADSWRLELNSPQFNVLSEQFRTNGLPTDLFVPVESGGT